MVREHYPDLLAEEGEDPKGPRSDTEGGPRVRNPGEKGLASEVRELRGRVFELSEFLVRELGVEDVGARFPRRVTLHPTCHSMRGIDVGDAPLRLLAGVRGLEVVELPNAMECCGFGGTFSVKNPHTSMAMLADKIGDVRSSGAEVLTSVDNSCLMHMAGGLHRLGLLDDPHSQLIAGPPAPTRSGQAPAGDRIRVMHLAEILACGEGIVS
jgi:Fe-S oxidoreductase